MLTTLSGLSLTQRRAGPCPHMDFTHKIDRFREPRGPPPTMCDSECRKFVMDEPRTSVPEREAVVQVDPSEQRVFTETCHFVRFAAISGSQERHIGGHFVEFYIAMDGSE